MITKLGVGKVYFKNEDFGKMLKLRDVNNLIVGDIKKDDKGVEVSIITSEDNKTNNRIKVNDEEKHVKLLGIDFDIFKNEIYLTLMNNNELELCMTINSNDVKNICEIANNIRKLTDSIFILDKHGFGCTIYDYISCNYNAKCITYDNVRTTSSTIACRYKNYYDSLIKSKNIGYNDKHTINKEFENIKVVEFCHGSLKIKQKDESIPMKYIVSIFRIMNYMENNENIRF